MSYEALADKLIEYNKKFNLTAIKEKDRIMILHIEDCLTLCDFIPPNARVIDVGTGGGFPALPLAMARPDLEITALDSTAKKLSFVSDMASLFSLKVKTVCSRAEDAAKKYREVFDVAVSRGVTALPALCEICLPLVKTGGLFIAMKAADCSQELVSAQEALKTLGAYTESVHSCHLTDGTVHTLICIKKASPTDEKYPRRWNEIKKRPL